MDMWTLSAVVVCVLIGVLSLFLTLGIMKKTSQRAQITDIPIPKSVKEHPFILNPIIIMYIIFLLFTGLIIFYYWSQNGY